MRRRWLPNSARERELVGRFADAVESGDIDNVVTLLTDDALLTMPPQPLEYQGHEASARPYGMIVATLAGDAIAAITWFSDTGVFRHFGLPRSLPRL